MAESKNNFTNSRMNRDLDDRLVPKGEYREAQNISISTSEGDDVGTLQNILGNIEESDLNINTAFLEIIGQYLDEVNNDIYVFLTNYTDSSSDTISNNSKLFAGAECYIISYNTQTNVNSILSQGNFLNFSKTHPILGINILEDLLFWTDNRNQPRKINIKTAINNTDYYDTEDKISVAKFFPFNAPELYREIKIKAIAAGTNTRSMALPLGQLAPGNGIWGITENMMVTSVGVDSFVQKVNQTTTDPGTGIQTNYVLLSGARPAGTWAANEIITFTEYGMKDCVSKFLPYEFEAVLTADPNDTNRYVINSNQIPIDLTTTTLVNNMHASAQKVVETGTGATEANAVEEMIPENVYITVAADGLSIEFFQETAGVIAPFVVPLGGLSVKFFKDNPDYDANYSGDESYLKDKFIRFSYRYKFDDGEYSLIAPFTQIGFIPENDGYLLDESESKTARSSVMQNMENKVNCINLSIPTPFPSSDGTIQTATKWKNAVNMLNIDSIEILCAFSDETRIRLVERLDVENILLLSSTYGIYPPNSENNNSGNSNVLTYKYNSQKPSLTLPTSDTTRVFDKVPIKAFSQESAGNRIIYGNFIDKHTSPNSLQFRVSASKKSDITFSSGDQTKRSLPNHTLKENRTYQVGIVLSDRYGRQSDVILSESEASVSIQGTRYGESTLFNPYGSLNKFSAVDILDWTGDQLFLYLEKAIPESISRPGYPGFYSESNPLGWYTYKVVVKQQEQEYYNIFSAGAWRQDNPIIGNQFSYISLVNDNINKIPKNLSEVGPLEKSFSSDVLLYPKVNPIRKNITVDGGSVNFNFTGSFVEFSTIKSDKVDRIIYNSELISDPDTDELTYKGSEVPPDKVFMGKSSTLARISNNNTFGFRNAILPPDIDGQYIGFSTAADNIPYNTLGVYETNPVISNLDIYWETSTSGYISEINASISSGNLGPQTISIDTLEFFEDTELYQVGNGSVTLPQFGTVLFTIEALDAAGAFVNDPAATCVLNSVTSTDTGSANLNNGFLIVPQAGSTVGSFSGRFNLYATSFQYYRLGRQFDFFITITANNITNSNLSFTGQLSNSTPRSISLEVPGALTPNPVVGLAIRNALLPLKTLPTQTLQGDSLRPNTYPAPYTGVNALRFPQAASPNNNYYNYPSVYWLNHSTQYAQQVGSIANPNFDGTTLYSLGNQTLTSAPGGLINSILFWQFLIGYGASSAFNTVNPTTAPYNQNGFGFPYPNAETTPYWPKGKFLGFIQGCDPSPNNPRNQSSSPGSFNGGWNFNIHVPVGDFTWFTSNQNALPGVNGTLDQNNITQNLFWEIDDMFITGGLNNSPNARGATKAELAQVVSIVPSTGELKIDDQGFIDRFGENGTISKILTPTLQAAYQSCSINTKLSMRLKLTDASNPPTNGVNPLTIMFPRNSSTQITFDIDIFA